ncbi:hypothetical protein HDU96_000772, partial [Phlyctochytrium bullatum]
VLPLVNKPGVSPTCDTDDDKNFRIQTALAAGGGAPAPAVVVPAAAAPQPAAANARQAAPAAKGTGPSDAQRIAFLTANAGSLNNANLVPLTAPEVIPTTRRIRTAEQGCAELGNGFLCVDLARNARCINGKVSKNFVNPFSADDLLKACVGGFCGGGASANPCIADAAAAVRKMNEGVEFFLPPSGNGGAAAPVSAPAPAPAPVEPAQQANKAVGGAVNFKVANGRLAQQLDGAKSTSKAGDACTNDTCCGNSVCLCQGGKLVQGVSCGDGVLKCQVLPLVNKPGVSPTCDTEDDKNFRIQTALAAGGPPAPAAPPQPPAIGPKQAAPTTTESETGPSDAQRIAFLTINAGLLNNAKIVPLTAPEVIPTTRRTRTAEQGCAELGNGFLCVDLARNARCINGKVSKNFVNPFSADDLLKACVGGFCGGGASANPCVADAAAAVRKMNEGVEFFLPPSGNSGAAAPVSAPAQVAPAQQANKAVGGASNFKVANGRLAQQLDSAKATSKTGDSCTTDTCCGNSVCLCQGGRLVQGVSCGDGALKCQVLPLVNKPGVSPTCDTDEDKNFRIQTALSS